MAIINSVIAGGGAPAPTGTMYIISNGTYNVADKAIANVNVPTTAPARFIAYDIDANGKLTKTNPIIDLSNVTEVGPYGLYWAYGENTGSQMPISGTLDMSSIQTIGNSGLTWAFANTSITGGIDLSSLTSLGPYGLQQAFRGTLLDGPVDLSSLNFTGDAPAWALQQAFKDTKITSLDLSSLVNITGYSNGYGKIFAEICSGNRYLTSVDLRSLKVIEPEFCFSNSFNGCSNLTTVNLSSLERIGSSLDVSYITQESCSYMFYNCGNLTQIDLGKLKTIKGNKACGYMFYGCGLTRLSFPSLEKIGPAPSNSSSTSPCYQMFSFCNYLTTAKFESLTTLGRYSLSTAFYYAAGLQSLWFYALSTFGSVTNCFTAMLAGCSNVTVHFPMAIQATIGSWSDVTGGFGGTNTTVLFDLATSLTGADTNTYTRQEKDSTATATAWLYNDVLYYTSGVSDQTNGVHEPAVGDTIYSDAACTTAVTTISAIA